MKYNFNQTTFNRRYCLTCNQEQRKDRGEWEDFGPLSVCPDACTSEKKQLLALIYDDPKPGLTEREEMSELNKWREENNKPDSKSGSYATLRIAYDEVERDILNRIYNARDLHNSIIKDSGVIHDTGNDLLYCDEIWVVEAAGVTCRWSHGGPASGISFYSGDMLGDEWEYHCARKANKFIASQRIVEAAQKRAVEEADLATYRRVQAQFDREMENKHNDF